MKKLVSVLFVSLLVAGFAFAADPKITVAGWGRTFMSVAQNSGVSGSDNQLSTGPWWAPGGRVRASIEGTSDNVGFLLQFFYHGGAWFQAPDNARMWVKFNDMFTVQMGRMRIDTLRGKIADSDFIVTTDNDSVFKRFAGNAAALLEVRPVKGVYIGAMLDSDDPSTAAAVTGNGAGTGIEYTIKAEDAYKNIQVAAGYDIDKVGLIRAQYIGLSAGRPINVAFAYTGMKGLVLDAGVFIPTTEDNLAALGATVASNKISFGIYATYSMDALALIVRTNTKLLDTLAFTGSIDASYVVAKPASLGVELQFAKDASIKTMTPVSVVYNNALQIAPYVKLAYGSGYLKGGFTYNMGLSGSNTNTSWSVPIMITYAF